MAAMKAATRRDDDTRGRDGELTVQAFGPGARVFCGVLAAAHVAYVGAMLMGAEPLHAVRAVTATLFAVLLSVVAVFGWRSVVTDPLASERFLELADPARALTSDDFAPGTAEHEQRPPSADAENGTSAPFTPAGRTLDERLRKDGDALPPVSASLLAAADPGRPPDPSFASADAARAPAAAGPAPEPLPAPVLKPEDSVPARELIGQLLFRRARRDGRG